MILNILSFIENIIVVNDNSKDNAAEDVVASGVPRVILIHHQKNQGVGGAMVGGYQRALDLGLVVVAKLDGDGQVDPFMLSKFIAPLPYGKADYTNRHFS